MFEIDEEKETVKKLAEQASVIAADESGGFAWQTKCGALIEKCKTAVIAIQPRHSALAEELSILAANLDLLASSPRSKSHRDCVVTSIELVIKQAATL